MPLAISQAECSDGNGLFQLMHLRDKNGTD